MRVYKTDTDNIYFAGDLHGEFPAITVTINRFNLENCTIVICGDIGIGFEKEEYYNQTFNKLTKGLSKRNIHLYLFRGNHDNKDYFNGGYFQEFEFVHVIPDYSVISTPIRNILCVGGATSIDRTWRKENMNLLAIKYMKHHSCGWEEAEKRSTQLYWENEPIVFDENELKQLSENNIMIDTVCTHTAPSFCNPITKNGLHSWLSADPLLSVDLDNERKTCDNILNYLKENKHPLQNWYYGHFHFHNVEIIDNIKYTLLDMSRGQIDLT